MSSIDCEHGSCVSDAPEKRSPRRSLFERLLMMAGWTDLDIQRRRNRLALQGLTDEQLKDIGLSRWPFDGTIHPLN